MDYLNIKVMCIWLQQTRKKSNKSEGTYHGAYETVNLIKSPLMSKTPIGLTLDQFTAMNKALLTADENSTIGQRHSFCAES
jgi:hypothetical protein